LIYLNSDSAENEKQNDKIILKYKYMEIIIIHRYLDVFNFLDIK